MIERITNHKKIILDYLKSVKTHPSADAVYQAVKKRLPRISLGTVYRVINNLKEKGEIIEIPSEVTRYDGNISPHLHFICEKCVNIFDIYDKCDFLKHKKTKVGKIKSYQVYPAPFGKSFTTLVRRYGTIKRCGVYFYGQCKNCQKYEKLQRNQKSAI